VSDFRLPRFQFRAYLKLASITFLQMAAGAFSRPPSKVRRTIDVVEASYSTLQSEVFFKWRHMRSLKSFSQPYPSSGRAGYASSSPANDVWVLLLIAVVHAGRRSEENLDTPAAREAIREMGIDQHAQHTASFVVFNKSHTPMSAARLNTTSVFETASLHAASWQRSRTKFSTLSNF